MASFIKKPINLIIILLLILNILPILAPVFQSLGLHFLSKPIYFVYSFFCHQFSTRSLHIDDHQVAWCARDMGMWFGWLITVLALKYGFIKKIKLIYLPLLLLPMILDGVIQTIYTFISLNETGSLTAELPYLSNNLTRFLTGILFGIGIAGFLIPFLISVPNNFKKFGNKILNYNGVRVLSLVLIGFIFYFLFIQIWNLTSENYHPSNILDTTPKFPENNFFERRKNGECPTDGYDLFRWECFF